MKEKLYIFDKYDNLLAITDNYIKTEFEETVEMPVSFLIEFPMADDDAKYLVGGNQVAFRDLKGDFRLFTIREVDDQDGEATEKIVNCMPGIQELTDVMVEERRPQDKTSEYVLGLILENARWQVGKVVDLGKNSTSFYFKNAYECLGELTKTWGGEFVDRVEIKGNKIAGRYVDIVHRKGSDTGKRFEMDKDIKNITRTVLYYPKTALYGKGKSLETENEGHTRKITFRDVVWSKKKGDPVDKPKGQEWVGDPEALEKHGVPNHETGKLMHRFGLLEDNDEENPERLLAKTWQAVQEEKDPKVQYKMDIITFYGIADYEHEQVFLGDTGIARDKGIKPMILVEARIMSWKYDIGNPRDGSLVLGNILDLHPDDSKIEWVVDKVKENAGNWDAGGGPITDKKFPDIKPAVPKNFKAEGLFQTVMLSWTFESTYAIAAYEIYASQMNGFAPDKTNLIFRGKVGGYNHKVNTDEKWYYRIRAVNTHGTASEYSEQVSASTVQLDLPDIEDIVPDFIEYGIYKGDKAPSPKDYKFWLDTSKEPNILRHWDEESETWKPLAPTNAGDIGAVSLANYQEQVGKIVSDLANKVDLEWINGQLVSKANKDDVYTIEQLDNKFSNVVSKTRYESDKKGIITDLKNQESRISQTETDIKSKVSNTQYKQDKQSLETSINKNKSSIEQNVKEIASKVSNEQYKTDKEGIINDIRQNKSSIEQNAKSIKSKVDSTYVNNAISESKSRNYGYKYAKDIVIYGDSDKYYPVIIKGGDQYVMRDILVKRGYSEQAPNDWHNPTHKGALTLLIKTNFGGWGGTRYAWDIYALNQEYAETFAGAEHVATYNMFAIFLRGGGETGALYHLYSDQSLTHNKYYQTPDGDIPPSPQIAYNKDLIFYALEGKYVHYAPEPRTLTDEVRKEIKDHSFIDLGKETAKEVKTVKQYASEIEQTAKGIKQEVLALETDYSTFKNQTNSTFKQQAGQIESKVTKTEYKVDIDGLRVKVNNAESSIKQNADNIVSKVSKNGVVSSINQSPEQIKISAERVSIDGDLVVKNGKVYIKDGVITNKLIAGSAKIDGAKIADATITNAKISSINADKIKAGIIDANKVLIRVKNGTQSIQIDDKGFESVDSKGKVRIHIGVRDIAGKGQSDPSTIRFFSGNGSNAASIGMNVNDDFIVGSQNNNVSMSLYSGKNMLFWADKHRFAFNQGPSGNYWEFNDYKDGDKDWHPRIYSNRSGGGYVGIKSRRLWMIYVNHLNYNELHKLSTREQKENIQELLPETAQSIFDQINIKKYHYINDDQQSSLRKESYGPIAEESPTEILSVEGDALVQDNYINVIAGALKYQTGRVDSLTSEIELLKQEINQLKGES